MSYDVIQTMEYDYSSMPRNDEVAAALLHMKRSSHDKPLHYWVPI